MVGCSCLSTAGGCARPPAHLRHCAAGNGCDLSDRAGQPYDWPVPALEPAVWSRLPEENDGLEALAARYYGACSRIAGRGLASGHSSPAGAVSPRRRGHYRALYAETSASLAARGFIRWLGWMSIGPVISWSVWICGGGQSEQPYRQLVDIETLLGWHEPACTGNGGLSGVVDEAFADLAARVQPAASSDRPGLMFCVRLGQVFWAGGSAAWGFCVGLSPLLAALQRNWALERQAGRSRDRQGCPGLTSTPRSCGRSRLHSDGMRLELAY